MLEFIQNYGKNLYELFLDMSFYMMLGLLFVGILHVFVKKQWITSQIGDASFWSVVKASVIGVPLPLCSCGVVPTSIELKKSGGSNGSVVSFLTSTPQTGVDSIIATWGLLGPVIAIFRALAAFVSGIVGGAVVNLLAKDVEIGTNAPAGGCCCHSEPVVEEESHCCCHSEPVVEEESHCCCHSVPVVEEEHHCCCHSEPVVEEEHHCCCHSEPVAEEEHHCCCGSKEAEAKSSTFAKIKSVFSYGFLDFLEEIAGRFVIGLLLSALISTVIPADFFLKYGLNDGLIAMILMVLIGLPMYICSTSSIPIAVSLMAKGLSAGGAFVFLFAGPVTNIASLAILGKTLGKKITGIYVANAVIMAILFGLLFDFMSNLGIFDLGSIVIGHGGHHGNSGIFTLIIAAIFLALIVRAYVIKFMKK